MLRIQEPYLLGDQILSNRHAGFDPASSHTAGLRYALLDSGLRRNDKPKGFIPQFNNNPESVPMTYNFDPDRWYDDEYSLLEHALEQGRITPAEFDRQVEALSGKYDDMVARLDGTYQLPE